MSKRKAISKTIRFEVFKRDRFTCQYCGAKAPDVVLQVDHIHPVADDGPHDILNFATACFDCNNGKGARKLDDRSAVERQRVQIEELQERREQLEMMLAWRDQAEAAKVDVVEEVCQRVGARGGGFVPNESGKTSIRQWLRRFTLPELLRALDDSFDHYMKFDGNEPNDAAWELAFKKIPAIASLNQQAIAKPHINRLAYIQGIARKRFGTPRMNYVGALEEQMEAGCPLDVLERSAKTAADWDALCAMVWDHIDQQAEGTHGED